MALFGAPLAIENHAQSACLAALAIQGHIEVYNKELSCLNRVVGESRAKTPRSFV